MSDEKTGILPVSKRKPGGRPFPQGHKFATGRPKGSRNAVTIAMQEILNNASDGLMNKVLATAMAGDVTAMRLCLERLMPPQKDRTLILDLPPINKASDAVEVMADLTNKVSQGEVTPNEAMSVASVVEVYRKSVETCQIEVRMNELEAQLKKAGI